MIFSGEHHGTSFVEMILNGLYHAPGCVYLVKTQTRRAHRGYYQIGNSYAIQPCRTCKGIEGYRIVIDRIWRETTFNIISAKNARAEGGYIPAEFEILFRKLNPGWDEKHRWVFEFHVIRLADYGNEKHQRGAIAL